MAVAFRVVGAAAVHSLAAGTDDAQRSKVDLHWLAEVEDNLMG
jgi:hypothetical protein